MKARIRRKDGLYLHKTGGFTDKKNAALIEFGHAERVSKRLKKSGVAVQIES